MFHSLLPHSTALKPRRSLLLHLSELIFVCLSFIIILNPPQLVFAQAAPPATPPNPGTTDNAIPLGDYLRLSDNKKVSDVYKSPAFLINLLVRNLMVVAGLALVPIGLYAGFQFITGGKKGAESARQMLTSAAIGFILIFSAYWIIQIVKKLTGASIFL